MQLDGERGAFSGLLIGGYGLFGVIYAVTLRLMPAHRVRRVVEVTSIERLEGLFK